MLKVGTVCTGIGSPEVAISELGIEHEIVFGVEIDKYARQTYLANFKPAHMYTDMTKHDWTDHYVDIICGGIPCQSFSLAGKRLGELDPRGLLFYDFYSYLKKQRPKYFIIENVKGLLSDAGGKTFDNWLQLLSQSVNTHYNMFPHEDSLMYNVHWTVLNSKDFDVPQNRDRVFVVGIREDLPNIFRFPVGAPLTKRLKDVLEPIVDEKYYLSDKMVECLIKNTERNIQNNNGFKTNFKEKTDVANTVRANYYKMTGDMDYIVEPSENVYILKEVRTEEAKQERKKTGTNPFRGKKIEAVPADIINCLQTGLTKDNLIFEPACLTSKRTEFGKQTRKDYEAGNLKLERKAIQEIVPSVDGITNTISTVQKDNLLIIPQVQNNRIRRLTPLECFRLQGFSDDFIKPVSDTQLYKQAGNTITTTVIKAILKNLLIS